MIRLRRPLALGVRLALLLCALGAGRAEGAGARLFKSGPIQVTADGARVWAVNPDNDSITRIDTASDVATELSLPGPGRESPRGLSLKEDGSEVWVACHDSDRVYVLDPAGSVLARIDLPWGSGPYSVALARDQQKALVTLHRGEALAVLDVPGRRLDRRIAPVYRAPLGIAWMEDGVSAWVTHIFADGEHPFLSRVDFSGPEPKLTTQIRVLPAQPQRSSYTTQGIPAEGGYLTQRGHLAQVPSVSGRQELWLPTQYENIHDDSWSPDSTVEATIRRLKLATRTIPNTNNDKVVYTAVEVHDPTNGGAASPSLGKGWNAPASGPIDIGFSADGQTAYLLHELSNDLLVLPTATPAIKPSGALPLPDVAVGDRPIGLAVSPVADVAYVLNLLTRDVSVVDLGASGPRELRRIPVTPRTGEPLASAVLKGARLFHTSADPRVSVNRKVACASCHINAEHDGRGWSLENLPTDHGERSVQSLLGLKLTYGPADLASGYGQLHLSGDRDEVQDFEHTFTGAFMGGTGFLGAGACPEVAPPDPTCRNAGKSPDLDAVASYLLSLEPLHRSPHRVAGGGLSEAAIRGATFFLGADRAGHAADAGCAGCHAVLPPSTPGRSPFADGAFHDIGRRTAAGSEEELNQRPAPWTWAVNTQSLVGLFATPPWEGVATYGRSSMYEVLEEMASRASSSTPHGTPDGLTRRQLVDLAEFVLSVDGDLTDPASLPVRDTSPPRIVRVEPASTSRVDVWFSESVDPQSAASVSSWRIVKDDGTDMPVLAALHDARNGDHVTLTTRLDLGCGDVAYTLVPAAPVFDLAGRASGGVANALDPSDPANRKSFVLGRTLTITLGASGYENLTVPVHDAATIPGLTTWGHDAVWLVADPSSKGFVRFDWKAAFVQATGVSSSADLVAASFTLQGEFGDAQALRVRRVLQSWADCPTGGDFNSSPTGAPTVNKHAHCTGCGAQADWNQAGANLLGGTGGALGDYNAGFDLAQQVDVALTPAAVNERVRFASTLVTDAYRFWFDNPQVDYGHSIEIAPGGSQELKYQRSEFEYGEQGPVLEITYRVPGTPVPPTEVSGPGAPTPLLLTKLAGGNVRLRFQDLGSTATGYNLYEGAIGPWYSHSGAACGIAAPLVAGGREWTHAPAAGSRYFQVTASDACSEGPATATYPPGRNDCPP